MNRARQDPAAEGLWLATSAEDDIAFGRAFFGVDTGLLEDELAALPPAPPGASTSGSTRRAASTPSS